MFANAYTMRNCPKHRRTGHTLPFAVVSIKSGDDIKTVQENFGHAPQRLH